MGIVGPGFLREPANLMGFLANFRSAWMLLLSASPSYKGKVDDARQFHRFFRRADTGGLSFGAVEANARFVRNCNARHWCSIRPDWVLAIRPGGNDRFRGTTLHPGNYVAWHGWRDCSDAANFAADTSGGIVCKAVPDPVSVNVRCQKKRRTEPGNWDVAIDMCKSSAA